MKAMSDSLTLLYARYQMLRDTKAKLAIWLGVVFIAVVIVFTSYAGYFIRMLAATTDERSEVPRLFARTYLDSYLRGELGTLVSTILGLAIISVMIAPFTGTSATSLISHYGLVSLRASERHRFTDSIITQFFSSIAILQLMTLTTVASLLTLDRGRIEGILYAWASWPVLVILSTMFVWIAEYLYRKLGEKKRVLILLLALGLIGLAVLLDPDNGQTVFGIGTSYASIIQNFHAFDLLGKTMALTILVALGAMFLWISYQISKKALSEPELHSSDLQTDKKVAVWNTSRFITIELGHLAALQLWRNLEIRKPLIMAAVVGAAIMFFGHDNNSIISTMILIVPLIVCLSWGSNIFGILGPGLVWLTSKPAVRNQLLWIYSGLQIGLIIIMFGIMSIPLLVSGRADMETFAGIFLGLMGTAFVMTRSAMDKSVHQPYAYKAGLRGESILPPARLLSYTMRFSLWSGIFGFIIVSTGDITIQLSLVGLSIAWSVFRMHRLNEKWKHNPEIRNKIIHTVAND